MNGRIRAVGLLVLLFAILAAGVYALVLALEDSNELVAARNALERRDFSFQRPNIRVLV